MGEKRTQNKNCLKINILNRNTFKQALDLYLNTPVFNHNISGHGISIIEYNANQREWAVWDNVFHRSQIYKLTYVISKKRES